METETTIDALNELITINNDRIEGYETALEATEEYDLKTLFAQFISTSEKCKKELILEVGKLGGEPAEGTMTSGKFFRAWIDVKASLRGKDRVVILDSCDYGESEAQDTYDEVLDEEAEHLSIELQTMIIAQQSLLQADYDHVKDLTDALEAA